MSTSHGVTRITRKRTAPDQLARRRDHVHHPRPRGSAGKSVLPREGAEPARAAPADRCRQAHGRDDPPLVAPAMLDRLAERRRGGHRGERDQAAPGPELVHGDPRHGSTGSRSSTARARVGRTRLSGAGGIAGRRRPRRGDRERGDRDRAQGRRRPAAPRWKYVGVSPRAASAALAHDRGGRRHAHERQRHVEPREEREAEEGEPEPRPRVDHAPGTRGPPSSGAAAAARTAKKTTVTPSNVVLAK